MTWTESTIRAIKDLATRNHRPTFSRQELINQELDNITSRLVTIGRTPAQTLSRELQTLRNAGLLCFLSRGEYYFVGDNQEILQISENINSDFDEVIGYCSRHNKLSFRHVNTSDQYQLTKIRKGQQEIRKICVENYNAQCAFCTINENSLLVASHISRWSDNPDGRGDLENVICMCRFHDQLFENGFFTIDKDFNVKINYKGNNKTIIYLLNTAKIMTKPKLHFPNEKYILEHHARIKYIGS
jgi:hypothetical protein